MTTKLCEPSKAPVLYAAAEARRIDIERGGHGWIRLRNCGANYFYFDDTYKIWIENLRGVITTPARILLGNEYAPVTPEPEQEVSEPEKLMLENLLETNAKRCKQIEQLEKELAEALKNYHETLADHGELTRQFDELKEKQRRKSCDEKPILANRISYFTKLFRMGSGYYDAPLDIYYLQIKDQLIALGKEQVETWTWKYEEDL